MRKVFLFFSLIIVYQVFSQDAPPQGITYQAVAIDDKGQEIVGVDAQGYPIAERAISVRFSIIESSPSGNIEYQETHITNTDAYGLFTLIIGEGNPNGSNSFSDIKWGSGKKFLKVELDINASGNYSLSSVQQMMSVPYALYAEESKFSDTASYAFLSQGQDSTNQIQNLSIDYSTDSLTITKGNTISLAEYRDSLAYQTLSISNDSLFISNGNGVTLYEVTDSAAYQLINLNGDTLSITDGNSIILPLSSSLKDTSKVNELQDLFIQGDSLRLTKSSSAIFLSNNGSGNSNHDPNIAYVQDGCYYTTYDTMSLNATPYLIPEFEDSTQICLVLNSRYRILDK